MNKISRIFQQQPPMKLITKVLILTTPALVGGGWGLVAPTHKPVLAQQLVAATGSPVTTRSGAAEIALAEHLTHVGAKMYGAYWCPHCHSQKQLFGKEAWSKVTYIECAEDGFNANPRACNQAKVQAFPTWQINDKRYVGATSLFKLARASKYQGPTNFQNILPR